jgi:hypothetical protein
MRLAAFSLLATLTPFFLGMIMPGLKPAMAGTFVNLGPQVSSVSVQSGAFVDSDGKQRIYMALRGQPGHLVGCDLADSRCILNAALPGAGGAWKVLLSSDGLIYAAGDNGHVYRHKPGESTVDDLGLALPGENFVWDLAAGPDGEIFGATYPGGRLFRYDSKNGFSGIGNGSLVAGENYARTAVYDAKRHRIYVGVGTIHAHLIEVDPATGNKTELLADETAGQTMVYSLVLVPDEKGGDRLLVWLSPSNEMLVYNLKTRKVERQQNTRSLKVAGKSPTSQEVYYSDGTSLMSFDLDRPKENPRIIGPCSGANGMEWMGSDQLCVMNSHGQLVHYFVNTDKLKETVLAVPPQPIPIQSIALGPDGKMWMGGFLAGGTAGFDPVTGKCVLYHGLDQTERIGVLRNDLYFGVYPYGRLYRFNPSKPWSAQNPRKVGEAEGQSRPMAVLGVPEVGKVFVGMVPEYGQLGGHFCDYDPATDAMHDFGEIVPKQSIISLVYADGIVFGGTSIAGGMGVQSVAKEAKLFGWDPTKDQKIFEITPVPGALSLTCLINGLDGNIWGIADGTLFIFDPRTKQIVGRHELMNVDYGTYGVYRDGFLVIDRLGRVYGTLGGKLIQIDPATWLMTVIRDEDVALLAMDRDGRLYFRDTVNLWQYTP